MKLLDKTDIGKLVAQTPYSFGFQPENSIVVYWYRDDNMFLTQRSDINTGTISEIAKIGAEQGANGGVVLIYSDSFEGGWKLTGTNEDAHFLDNIDLVVYRVMGNQYMNEETLEMETIPQETLDVLGASRKVMPKRSDLHKEVNPSSVNKRAYKKTAKHVDDMGDYKHDVCVDLALSIFDEGFYAEDDALAVAYGLHDIKIRDGVLWYMSNLTTYDEFFQAYEAAAEVARITPKEHAAPILTVAAIAAWLTGNGARANICLEIVDEIDSEYGLANLISAALSQGMPPSMWLDSMSGLSYEDVTSKAA